ncbi:MAG TPA: cysteine dioxygenase family protein [Thermoanaerobaculia bacterium]|nr:cysteine dioxygenase family protein [Thermoanaerobaculia bacterium]
MPARHARLSPAELLGLALPPRPEAGHAPEEIRSVLDELGRKKPSWELLGPHVAFAPEGYLRKRLYRDEHWEMLLLCWLPGQTTVVHDHGGSWGTMLVLSGRLDERQYRSHGEGSPLTMCQLRRFGPQDVALETVETIHKNENRDDAPAISLHFYSPPLRVLNSYDPMTGRSHAVQVHEGPSVAVGGKPLRTRRRTLAAAR